MVRKFDALKKQLALHRLVRLRQRYIMTKSNRVRLRYRVATAATFVLMMAGALAASGLIPGLKGAGSASLYVAGTEYAQATQDRNADGLFQSGISEGIRKASEAIKKPARPLNRSLKVDNGDTFAGLLQKAGVSSADAYQAVQALTAHYDPRKIKPGQEIKLHFKPAGEDDVEFSEMTIDLDPLKQVRIVKKKDAGFETNLKEKPLEDRTHAQFADIETSLYGSALRAGIPAQVVAEVIRIYSWNIDFQRDIRQGDHIEVMYEAKETKDGDYAKPGNLLYASLTVGGKEIPIYRYEMADGRVDYFQPDGHSVRKMLLKTPIDGARLSSGFGMRKHPVLGYNKMHKGVDFAAASGTPIYAAGDGTIDFAGNKSGYGNYVRIRHNSSMKTAYAHMSRFAKGIGQGKRVKQGDVIGYVGMTGRTTGPHLHYEVLVNNAQVNPRSVDLPTGEQLEGREMKDFKSIMNGLRQQYVSLTQGMKLAQKETPRTGRIN
jgi:murein DD-endopeptidase MepM/ murein hydrolase activator NlpD